MTAAVALQRENVERLDPYRVAKVGGAAVSKMGQNSGWTTGNITNVSTDINFESDKRLIGVATAQTTNGTFAIGGDSGGPVFYLGVSSAVTLAGLIIGGSTSGSGVVAFSPMDNIRDEFGSIQTF